MCVLHAVIHDCTVHDEVVFFVSFVSLCFAESARRRITRDHVLRPHKLLSKVNSTR